MTKSRLFQTEKKVIHYHYPRHTCILFSLFCKFYLIKKLSFHSTSKCLKTNTHPALVETRYDRLYCQNAVAEQLAEFQKSTSSECQGDSEDVQSPDTHMHKSFKLQSSNHQQQDKTRLLQVSAKQPTDFQRQIVNEEHKITKVHCTIMSGMKQCFQSAF